MADHPFYSIQVVCGSCNSKVISSLLNQEAQEVLAAHERLEKKTLNELPICPGCGNNSRYRYVIKDFYNKVVSIEIFKSVIPPSKEDTITT